MVVDYYRESSFFGRDIYSVSNNKDIGGISWLCLYLTFLCLSYGTSKERYTSSLREIDVFDVKAFMY
ncbi:hypothetical protein KSD_62430 [Ktedonobacter sp. SOSP1-85]|nr:hypothetical protein KSD_62430 [Ktedonobacter sp. SOSP1-85]